MKMVEAVKITGFILLCLALSLNARPRLLREETSKLFHYTNIEDIGSQDILQLANGTSPDSDEINPEQIDDPYENNMETETTEYSKTSTDNGSPYLVTPRDQEQKFVNLLEKHYKGTFPEYGKETKSDFRKNKELEDNLSVQPESVYFGHSDKYQGKSGKNDGISDFPIPDEGELDKAAISNEDSNFLNSESLEGKSSSPTTRPQSYLFNTDSFEDVSSTTKRPTHTRTKPQTKQGLEDILPEYDEYGDKNDDDGRLETGNAIVTGDYGGLLSSPEKNDGKNDNNMDDETEKPRNENEHVMNGHVTEHATDKMEADMTDHEMDQMTDEMDDNGMDEMTDEKNNVKELEKLREKTTEEALWDAEEKLRQKLSRKKYKQKHLLKRKNKKEVKEEHAEGILKDFDELKKQGMKTSGEEDNGKTNTVQHNAKPGSHNKEGKQIKHLQADESQVAGDAILDFLDRLLEKDPKKLKQDVLAMEKEMQTEDTTNSGASETSRTAEADDEEAANSDSSNTLNEKPQVTIESPKANTKPDEVDNWISQLENNIDKNQENEIKDGRKQREEKPNETEEQNEATDNNVDDQEYYQFHDGTEDIYPDETNGQSTSAEQQDSEKSEKAKHSSTKKDVKEKKEDEFDYEEFKEEAVKMHNEYRGRHNAVALTWSESLAKKANKIASRLLDATRSKFKQELEKHGENIAILPYSTKNIAKKAVEKWYAEITKFSFTSPRIKPETRDFTQIIWKRSNEFGMGFVHTADKKKTLVVALYSPAGNDKKKLRDNLNTVHEDPYADIKKNILERVSY